MRLTPPSGHTPVTLRILLLTLAAGLALACGDVNAVLEKVSQARQLTADLVVQFTKASDAANRAVMADTDETSVAFARESRQAADTVQKDLGTLRPMLESLGFSDETRLLNEFANKFTEYRTLDQRILDLAVENTNVKAQRLAFGPAQDAADAFRDALNAATATVGKDESAWHLRAATAAPDRFSDLNMQIIVLSRKNTNVRSLALSLDEKRKLTTSCEESLQALQAVLAKQGFTNIREQ
jgi:hypothetical protein